MQFSEQWLRLWVNPTLNADELAHALTMAGLEISSVMPASSDLAKVKVGEIQTVEAHPDSDRLFITQVSLGAKQGITVVTNVAGLQVGAKVAVATVGAHLPDGMEIKPTDLRGVQSQGMFCSMKTLGLMEEDAGIYHFPSESQTGAEVMDVLALRGDHIFELEITPNRGDCLSVLGIAREVSVVSDTALAALANPTIPAKSKTTFPVNITAPALCPQYAGRVIENVDLSQPSPLWLQERLRRSGVRSINAVVDVTNYVMLELGQPLHAFDLGQLQGCIDVRAAVQGEHLTLLDGKTITLQAGQCVIADQAQPLALAGIMGGEHSGVRDQTQHLFLESAYFEPVHIAKNARHFGLSTDSSYRFERGVDPTLQARAIERATELLLDIVGGKPGPVIVHSDKKHMPQAATITLRRERIPALLGFDIADKTVENILKSLGMQVSPTASGWVVVPPYHRHDMDIEEDLIEEVVRVYGYDKIPNQRITDSLVSTLAPENHVKLSALKDLLNDRGYQEVITYSFVDPKMQAMLSPNEEGIALANPISQDLSMMRTNLWCGLVTVLQHNLNRQQKRGRFVESGMRFRVSGDDTLQTSVLAGLIAGAVNPEQWGEESRRVDFFDMKADIDALFALAKQHVEFTPSQHAALHPGQQANIMLGSQIVGICGQCHPLIKERLKMSEKFYLFEIELSALQSGLLPSYQPISKYPAIKRDIGLVVDQKLTAQQILDVIKEMNVQNLIDSSIFDIYQGEKLAENEKSIAIALIFQDLSTTLKESEVNESTDAIVSELARIVGAKLRDW